MNGVTMSDDTQDLRQSIINAMQTIEERNTASYDGVMGNLPEWFPETDKYEFKKTRDKLLDGYSHAEILEYIQQYQALIDWNNTLDGGVYIPPIGDYNLIFTEIDYLWWLFHIATLGKDKGLPILVGKDISNKYFDGENRQEGRSGGGRTTAQIKKDEAKKDADIIHKMATELLNSGKEKSEISSRIMERYEFSRKKIMKALHSHPSGLWKK